MDQGLGQIQNQLASRGLSESGAELKGMTRFAQGLADQDYGNQRNIAFNEFQGRQADRFGLAGMQNQFNNQQYGRELGLGQMGLDAIGRQTNMMTSQAGTMADLQLAAGQSSAATKMAEAQGIRDLLGQGAQAIGGRLWCPSNGWFWYDRRATLFDLPKPLCQPE